MSVFSKGNQYLFTVPYSPVTNAVEMWFNQLKTQIKKNRNVYTFDGLSTNIDKAIARIKQENYRNYFYYAYGAKKNLEYNRKPSTRKCKPKKYKE